MKWISISYRAKELDESKQGTGGVRSERYTFSKRERLKVGKERERERKRERESWGRGIYMQM